MKLPNYKESLMEKELIKKDYSLDSNLIGLGKGLKYHVKTYGCQMNEHDSENIRAMLEELGFTNVENYLDADVVILNTCSIRENAHNKAYGMLGRFKHLKETKKDLLIGLCGCMVQEEGVMDKVLKKLDFIDFIFGTHNINRLPNILSDSLKTKKQEIEVLSKEEYMIEGMPVKRDNKYKAYINVIYGCDKFCTYCIVPFTRGRQRSRVKEDILKEVAELIKDGYSEVTLLGQNVNAYGKDFDYAYTLENLLEDVAKTGIKRIRFMTSHPWDFSDKMIEVIAKYPNIMPAIHLPVQSGSNKILKLMGRRYTKEDYVKLHNKIKEKVPNASISTDIIVGFPGEEEKDFRESFNLVKDLAFDHVFSFIYSPRENTPAAKLEDNLTKEEKNNRLKELNTLVNSIILENNKKLINQTIKVLIEGINDKGTLFGYADNNKLVNVIGDSSLVGRIVKVKIKSVKTWSLNGEIDG